jgi:hypothetical protein
MSIISDCAVCVIRSSRACVTWSLISLFVFVIIELNALNFAMIVVIVVAMPTVLTLVDCLSSVLVLASVLRVC